MSDKPERYILPAKIGPRAKGHSHPNLWEIPQDHAPGGPPSGAQGQPAGTHAF